MEEKRKSGKPKKLSTAKEQQQRIIFVKKWGEKSSNNLTEDLRDGSGPSAGPATVH